MKSTFFTQILNLSIFCFLLSSCYQSPQVNAKKITVCIQNVNGKYQLYRNGKPFFIKGASGSTNLKQLAEAGGNTIRVWDTLNLGRVLDSAQANHLAVVVGLPMPSSESLEDFYNTPKANIYADKIANIVERFKNHPALLTWCLGNELAFPNKPKYNRFYATFNDIVDMIHEKDPNHPVTTTIMSFQKKNIVNIRLRTKIDFISFNIFGSIQTLKEDLENFKWFWNGPFLITEWGIEGPWLAENRNAWGAYIESTSAKKAEQYLTNYKKYMPVNDPGFLGSMVFYWGQKQELTPTWFSMFDENGAETEAVQVMRYIWTGKKTASSAPALKYMLLDGKGARDNILFQPAITVNSKVYFENTDTTGLTFKWKIFHEDWFKPNGTFNEKKPKEIEKLIIRQHGSDLSFKVPDKEGPYRILVYVYNQRGVFATSNTPFYVLKNP
ncbi:Glycosyl hydrolases family 2, TIM barrel domain [Mucilaginibacter gossypiicola]|uniref:Glycosyl hydrolases family 2, TIM barrel domain n=1 Tax=Mucilaginibacter gossypiicola TaxID=551995 RepID=A0A1H8NZW1_9SPHI|nr:glycoside hydrolase family 2 TIM barrel-domain containing protein [Mucilaginibacter gossypiicola]SEO34903.1 Glycosyl hydrolases family 2, TIM barrel domain [Mucilaginibacter gossypiicola]